MAHTLDIPSDAPRSAQYAALVTSLEHLLEGEDVRVANLANAASLLHMAFGWHWVGFYLVDPVRDALVLGPFQGPVACTRLFRGKGVCAAAWERAETVVVPDVEAFPGHVACSSLSRSEVVVPIRVDGEVVGVLDVDSAVLADFGPEDAQGLEAYVAVLERRWNQWR
jgi:L-methionine (R)-S-oxide reductase